MVENKYIDRLALKPLFDERYHTAFIQEKTRENPEFWHGVCTGINWGLNTIMDAPVADVVEVVHGEWIEKTGRAICSACADECWADSVMEYSYCPNCGAKMDGGNKNNESIHM